MGLGVLKPVYKGSQKHASKNILLTQSNILNFFVKFSSHVVEACKFLEFLV